MMYMYFIAVVLPAHLDEKILEYKYFMRDHFGSGVGLKSPAHITIVPPFWMQEEQEPQLIRDIDALSALPPFPVATRDLAAFKPRTIFVALESNRQLDEVKRQADAFFSGHPGYQIKKENRSFHPHITIATRDLDKKAFGEAWALLGQKKFRETWLADGLSLLRHNKKNWDVVYTSQFRKV